jgi:hypothetical protein
MSKPTIIYYCGRKLVIARMDLMDTKRRQQTPAQREVYKTVCSLAGGKPRKKAYGGTNWSGFREGGLFSRVHSYFHGAGRKEKEGWTQIRCTGNRIQITNPEDINERVRDALTEDRNLLPGEYFPLWTMDEAALTRSRHNPSISLGIILDRLDEWGLDYDLSGSIEYLGRLTNHCIKGQMSPPVEWTMSFYMTVEVPPTGRDGKKVEYVLTDELEKEILGYMRHVYQYIYADAMDLDGMTEEGVKDMVPDYMDSHLNYDTWRHKDPEVKQARVERNKELYSIFTTQLSDAQRESLVRRI